MTTIDGNPLLQPEDRDDTDLLERAKAILIAEQSASISLLQRRLLIGYSAALRLMTKLEQAGIVTVLNPECKRTLTAAYLVPVLDVGSVDRAELG